MGHTLNYKIVAEGVETMDAVRILEKLSCDLIQGYYYSKPLDETSILRYIEKFKV